MKIKDEIVKVGLCAAALLSVAVLLIVVGYVFDDMKNFFWDYSLGGDCASAGPC